MKRDEEVKEEWRSPRGAGALPSIAKCKRNSIPKSRKQSALSEKDAGSCSTASRGNLGMHFWIDKRGQQRCCVHVGGRGRRSTAASVPVTARGRRRKPMVPPRVPGPSPLTLASPPPQLQPPSLPTAPPPPPETRSPLRYAVSGVAITFMCFLLGINLFKGSGLEGIFCVVLVIVVLAGCTIAMCHMKSGYEGASVESPQTAPPAQIQLPQIPAPPPPIPIVSMEEMPPPPYEIAILIPEAPPPSYDKAVG